MSEETEREIRAAERWARKQAKADDAAALHLTILLEEIDRLRVVERSARALFAGAPLGVRIDAEHRLRNLFAGYGAWDTEEKRDLP